MTYRSQFEVNKYEAVIRSVDECRREQLTSEATIEAAHNRIDQLEKQVESLSEKLEKLKEWTMEKVKGSNA